MDVILDMLVARYTVATVVILSSTSVVTTGSATIHVQIRDNPKHRVVHSLNLSIHEYGNGLDEIRASHSSG
jgi:hypothetical protein